MKVPPAERETVENMEISYFERNKKNLFSKFKYKIIFFQKVLLFF